MVHHKYYYYKSLVSVHFIVILFVCQIESISISPKSIHETPKINKTSSSSSLTKPACKLVFLNKDNRLKPLLRQNAEVNLSLRGKKFTYREKSVALICNKNISTPSTKSAAKINCNELMKNHTTGGGGTSGKLGGIMKSLCIDIQNKDLNFNHPCKPGDVSCKILSKLNKLIAKNKSKKSVMNASDKISFVKKNDKAKKKILLMLPCKEKNSKLTKKWLHQLQNTLGNKSMKKNTEFMVLLSCRARKFFNKQSSLKLIKNKFKSIITFEPDEDYQNSNSSSNHHPLADKTISYCDRQAQNSRLLSDLAQKLESVTNLTMIHRYSPSTSDAMIMISDLILDKSINVDARKYNPSMKNDDLFGEAVLYLGGTRRCHDTNPAAFNFLGNDSSIDESTFNNNNNKRLSCDSCWGYQFLPLPQTTTTSTTTDTTPATTRTNRRIDYEDDSVVTGNDFKSLPTPSSNDQINIRKKEHVMELWTLLTRLIAAIGIINIIITELTYYNLIWHRNKNRQKLLESNVTIQSWKSQKDFEFKYFDIFLPISLILLYVSLIVFTIIPNDDFICTIRRILPSIGITSALAAILSQLAYNFSYDGYTVNDTSTISQMTTESDDSSQYRNNDEEEMTHNSSTVCVTKNEGILIMGVFIIIIQTVMGVFWTKFQPNYILPYVVTNKYQDLPGAICLSHNIMEGVRIQFFIGFSLPIIEFSLTLFLTGVIVLKSRVINSYNFWSNVVALIGTLTFMVAFYIGLHTKNIVANPSKYFVVFELISILIFFSLVYLRPIIKKSIKIYNYQIQQLQAMTFNENNCQHLGTKSNSSRYNSVRSIRTLDRRTNYNLGHGGTVRSVGSYNMPNIIVMPESSAWQDIVRWECSEGDDDDAIIHEDEEDIAIYGVVGIPSSSSPVNSERVDEGSSEVSSVCYSQKDREDKFIMLKVGNNKYSSK